MDSNFERQIACDWISMQDYHRMESQFSCFSRVSNSLASNFMYAKAEYIDNTFFEVEVATRDVLNYSLRVLSDALVTMFLDSPRFMNVKHFSLKVRQCSRGFDAFIL